MLRPAYLISLTMLSGAFAMGVASARASSLPPNGTIIGVFDQASIVTSGNVLNDPDLNETTLLNNAGSAFSTITNSTDPTLAGTGPALQATGSSLIWGTNAPTGPGSFSELVFVGAQVPTNIHQNFLAGRLTYLNGTSQLTSLIFGATIDFYDESVSPANFLGSDQIIINTTNNLDNSIAQDADFINICGNNSNICNAPLEAYEDTEGGTGVTADLTATIVGDPQLVLENLSLTAGQDPATSGFIGDSPPLAEVPEPPSLSLLGFGLAALGLLARRRA